MYDGTIKLKDIILSIGPWPMKAVKCLDYIAGGGFARVLTGKNSADGSKDQTNPERVLIIRPGGIGDAVFLLPIFRALKDKYPSLVIDILCEKRNAGIFKSQSRLCDNVFDYTKFRDLKIILNTEYDLVFDTEQWHYLSAIVAYYCKSPITVGFGTRKHRAKLFTHPMEYQINGHELDNFARLFDLILKKASATLTIDNCYDIPETAQNWANGQISGPCITLFLGGSIPVRRLTIEQTRSVIDQILSAEKTALLIGGKDVEKFSHSLGYQTADKRIRNYVGKISLDQTAALIKNSELFIGTDSGIMHLACAVGTKVIAIFGPGNLQKWKPIGDKHTIMTENVSCSPCTRFGYTVPTCGGEYQCMREIPINSILINQNRKL